jgi:hypothetical protein
MLWSDAAVVDIFHSSVNKLPEDLDPDILGQAHEDPWKPQRCGSSCRVLMGVSATPLDELNG